MTIMTLQKTICNNKIVFNIDQNFVDDILVQEILEKVEKNKTIGINMQNVQNINSPLFLECLIKNKFKLFNLQSEILAYLAISLKDGFLKSYASYSDFSDNKRELFKRRFLVA